MSILNRIEIRKRFLNRVLYVMFARVQIVSGISSRYSEDYNLHRILWDLDSCTLDRAKELLLKIQQQYNLGNIDVISDKEGSYGAICNSIVTFKELIHILVDTELIDPLFVRYCIQRHEAIIRLSDKENRPIHRETVARLYRTSDRFYDEVSNFYKLKYETGYIKEGIRTGDFYNDQKTV
jgi:hypothetical protein